MQAFASEEGGKDLWTQCLVLRPSSLQAQQLPISCYEVEVCSTSCKRKRLSSGPVKWLHLGSFVCATMLVHGFHPKVTSGSKVATGVPPMMSEFQTEGWRKEREREGPKSIL